MAKDFKAGRDREVLVQRPFQELRGMKVGPACLHCGEPIDVRPGASLKEPKGSHVGQRQGFLHEDTCREQVELASALSSFNNVISINIRDDKDKRKRQNLDLIKVTPGRENRLAVPVMDTDELHEYFGSLGILVETE